MSSTAVTTCAEASTGGSCVSSFAFPYTRDQPAANPGAVNTGEEDTGAVNTGAEFTKRCNDEKIKNYEA